MIPIPFHPRFSENLEKVKHDQLPCVVCGKSIKTPRRWVRVVNGGCWIGTPADAIDNPAADMGYFPIGSDCLRNYPEIKQYTQDNVE